MLLKIVHDGRRKRATPFENVRDAHEKSHDLYCRVVFCYYLESPKFSV